jgi:hypothetical protein
VTTRPLSAVQSALLALPVRDRLRAITVRVGRELIGAIYRHCTDPDCGKWTACDGESTTANIPTRAEAEVLLLTRALRVRQIAERVAARRVRAVESEVRAKCDRLRETAEELRRGEIHPAHAANRVQKIANEIARPRAK